MDILVFGGGNRARSVIDVIHRVGEHRVAGIVLCTGNAAEIEGHAVVLGGMDDLPAIVARTGIKHGIIAISDVGSRMEIAQRITGLLPDFAFITAIDPNATLGSDVRFGAGTIVLAGARIESASVIGEHVEVGSNTVVGAGTHLGNFVSVGAGVVIGEGCHAGSGTAIGLNAALVKEIIIGTHCVVGPGAIVMESVPDLHVAIGIPAKCVRTRLVGERYL